MSDFRQIDLNDFDQSPFRLIGKDWMLIAAECGGKVNAMTASWGGLGVFWGRNAAFVFVRDSRYTKELIDGQSAFSLSFFDAEKYRRALSYFGSVSGRDEDKIVKSGLSIVSGGAAPYFAQARTVLVCQKLLASRLTPETFLLSGADKRYYPDADYHTLYIGQITEALAK